MIDIYLKVLKKSRFLRDTFTDETIRKLCL